MNYLHSSFFHDLILFCSETQLQDKRASQRLQLQNPLEEEMMKNLLGNWTRIVWSKFAAGRERY